MVKLAKGKFTAVLDPSRKCSSVKSVDDDFFCVLFLLVIVAKKQKKKQNNLLDHECS